LLNKISYAAKVQQVYKILLKQTTDDSEEGYIYQWIKAVSREYIQTI
jgi:hemerythrin superfamily protein